MTQWTFNQINKLFTVFQTSLHNVFERERERYIYVVMFCVYFAKERDKDRVFRAHNSTNVTIEEAQQGSI